MHFIQHHSSFLRVSWQQNDEYLYHFLINRLHSEEEQVLKSTLVLSIVLIYIILIFIIIFLYTATYHGD